MKIIWLILALFGVSVWYIPNTVSLLSGQHSFYNLDANGSQVPCRKCHGDISAALHNGYVHNNFTCDSCHRVKMGVQFASGDGGNLTPGTMAHAASMVECAECHSLNITPDAIHGAFIRNGIEHNSSDNCIACHTEIAVSINWTKPGAISIDTKSNGNNITINGTRHAYNITFETFGNRSGDVIAVSNVTVVG